MLFKLLPYFTQNGYPEVINLIDELPNHPTARYAKRNLEGIDKLVLHHTASEAPLRNQATYHVNGRGWPRIGYSIVIDKDRIYQTNYLDTLSYHCSGQNTTSIGVCILADFTKRQPTEMERKLLTAVIVSLKAQFPNIVDVYPHKEFQPTSCPVIPIEPVREEVMAMAQEIEQMESPVKKEEIAFRMANQFMYLYNMFQLGKTSTGQPATEGQKKWALESMLKLEPEMRKQGMLK